MSAKRRTYSVSKSGPRCYGIHVDGRDLMTLASPDDLAFALAEALTYLSWIEDAVNSDWQPEDHETSKLDHILSLTQEALRERD